MIDFIVWLFYLLPRRYVFSRPKTLELWYAIGSRTICIRYSVERKSVSVEKSDTGAIKQVNFVEAIHPKYQNLGLNLGKDPKIMAATLIK